MKPFYHKGTKSIKKTIKESTTDTDRIKVSEYQSIKASELKNFDTMTL